MAALTVIAQTSTPHSPYQLLETISITNQVPNSAAVTKAVPVPRWADYCTIVINDLTLAGTSPLFDFVVKGVDVALSSGLDDGNLFALGGWDGITQKTAASATTTTIDIGPHITTDDTGSATATDAYGVTAVLPPFIAYTYTTDGTTDDEDYSATISVYWRRGLQ